MERTRKYYRDRAAYMYQLAAEAETDALRASCLRAAEEFERFAEAILDDEEQRKAG
jgi:hypothetical protein